MATCDEMRDHLFQLLRPKYFRKWKQRHQVYYKCVPSACWLQLCIACLPG